MISGFHKHWFLAAIATIAVCGPPGSLAGSRLTVSPLLTFTRFGNDLSLNQAFGYGLLVAYHPDSDVSFGVSATLTPTEEEFALVGGTGHFHTNVGSLRLQTEYTLFQPGSHFSVFVSAFAGALFISTDEYRVSLGALGQTTIPARSETMFLYGASLVLRQQIAGNVSLRLEPGASLYSHNGASHSLFSIAGGISVGIL